MPRREPVRVPIDEIRRTLETLDRRHARNGTRGRRETPQTTTANSLLPQLPDQHTREPTRIPLDEVCRTLADWKRRRAEERALQRREALQRTTLDEDQSPTEARKEPIDFSLQEIRRTMYDLDQQRSKERDRRRHEILQETVPTPRNEPLRVPLDEIRRAMEDLDRQHKQDRREASRRRAMRDFTHRTITPPLHPDVETSLSTTIQTTVQTTDKAQGRPTRRARSDLLFRPLTVPPPIHPLPSLRQTVSPDRRPIPPPSLHSRGREEHATTPCGPLQPPMKKRRLIHETTQLQGLSIRVFLQHLDTSFAQKEEASRTRSWCKEVPLPLQVETARSFYQAFADEKTLPISHCAFCYRKAPPGKLNTIQWKAHGTASLLHAARTIPHCYECLPSQGTSDAAACSECHASFAKGRLPKACSVNNIDIGCEHAYPAELDDLSPVEERLIALQGAFGYITKFTVDRKTRSGVNYRKHVKGHIVVFPNKVEDLVATVLPHPLLRTIENIHVSWSGSSKPNPADVGHLLRVRKSRLIAALSWLRGNNPLYKHITVDHAEMTSWHYADGSNVPTIIMDRMQREEPSILEKAATDHIVPDTDRGHEDRHFTSIEDLLASAASISNDGRHPCQAPPESSERSQPPSHAEPSAFAPDELRDNRADDTTYENLSSAMFPLDGPGSFEDADKLSFLVDAIHANGHPDQKQATEHRMDVHSASNQPFIRVDRGADFADNLHADYFPRTFPTLFPWGRGGPKALPRPDQNPAEPTHNHSLLYWAKYVLQRHGGRFATHPVFCFLIFNTMLRSSNRRISMLRMSRRSFEKVEEACESLTMDRLKRAMEEMQRTGLTADQDVTLLLRELFVFGHAQPLSNESRLLMRRKIQALCIRFGMPAIWFTINPNDINNPVKMKLAVHRLHDNSRAKSLLAGLQEGYDRIALSTMDPVSSALFFHREVSLFFEKYVRTGEESVFGKISHYYATVETNERGSLHLHGLLWPEGNMGLPTLADDIANPDETEYRANLISYVNSVFHECLDEKAGKATRRDRKPIHPVVHMVGGNDALTAAFDNESNFIAYCCQIHSHTYTCIKYSLQGVARDGATEHRRTTCRFKAPWKTVEQTGFTTDGLLQIRRNHPLVNRYNRAMAVGLRHNHDVSLILTKTKGLAMIYYITNYATKLNTPMWKRLALAADILQQHQQSPPPIPQRPDTAPTTDHPSALRNKTRQFLMRTANRIFSERELSAVEVCYHLFDYSTDFTNVPNWSFLHLNTLYWAIFRRWPYLRRLACLERDKDEPMETVSIVAHGRTLSYFEAYGCRGALLTHLCFYDYISMIRLVPRKDRDDDEFHLSLSNPDARNWMQKLRRPHEYAIPIFQGFISDDHKDDDPDCFKRNSVLHLALFVPWQSFLSTTDGDITDIWFCHEAALPPRLRFSVSNISLLRKSAEDARKDARLWASRSEAEGMIDVGFPPAETDDSQSPATTAEHHQTYTAMIQSLQNAIRNSNATKGSPVLQDLVRDLHQENLPEESQPLVERHEEFYSQIRRNQDSPLNQWSIPSPEDIQAAAKAQHMLHLRMLDEMETGPQGTNYPTENTDIDDVLDRHCGTGTVPPWMSPDLTTRTPRISLDTGHTFSFAELGHQAATQYTLNYLQRMALQLVCTFLDRHAANSDSAGQHLQYIGGPGGTGKSRIIDAIKHLFAARSQQHLLQVTGSSGSAAAQIGGTTVHSACGLDTHRGLNEQPPHFSEAKKWAWKQKLVFVIDEVSMLGGATLFKTSSNLQALRDCFDKPFGGIPVVILMGDFYQFAPVLETSLLINQTLNFTSTSSLGPGAIPHHRGYNLWLLFTSVILLEEQVRAAEDSELVALLNRVRAGTQTVKDLDLLNTKLADRSHITFKDGLRAITPLNRNRWSLNMEAVVDWARSHKKHISIFISTHIWRSSVLSQDEVTQTIEQGDDSHCKIPGVFFYAQGMPLVVNQNIYTGIKIVNGAEFTAVDIIPDPKYPGYHLADDVTVHFGPPLGILLQSDETKGITIPGLPPDTVLIRPISFSLAPTDRRFKFLSSKCTRRGLPAVPGFVITDYKAQSKTFAEVLLELRGNRITNGEPSKCDFTSLYVQLSRCKTLRGIKILSPIRPQDFIENKLDQKILDAMQRLTDLATKTRRIFEKHQPLA